LPSFHRPLSFVYSYFAGAADMAGTMLTNLWFVSSFPAG